MGGPMPNIPLFIPTVPAHGFLGAGTPPLVASNLGINRTESERRCDPRAPIPVDPSSSLPAFLLGPSLRTSLTPATTQQISGNHPAAATPSPLLRPPLTSKQPPTTPGSTFKPLAAEHHTRTSVAVSAQQLLGLPEPPEHSSSAPPPATVSTNSGHQFQQHLSRLLAPQIPSPPSSAPPPAAGHSHSHPPLEFSATSFSRTPNSRLYYNYHRTSNSSPKPHACCSSPSLSQTQQAATLLSAKLATSLCSSHRLRHPSVTPTAAHIPL
ncbi:proline-rich receptor-like protein kinase PERK9 [Malania oleifera]|uniref:proline-rich receptor-like protein kinase PERK9 n=1 Tax=Malania oleifera TaxID=397392 RepID=UPI0025ADABD3|nr:proline-rich receptor-like protein kinase PERK9 [Malania oleifera]